MRLNSIELKGFKSFGDKVVIHFNKGVTGIVGPNGCGKSNVVDAMRWVLGEQKSRALRSDKMESVIFNGTKDRKAAQMAEVSLSFENTKNILPTEFHDVKITRRLFRSGESEYLLNNVNCRLKDITNLFMDTGIGSDSYAIIELKKVEDLLHDKDNTRRTLLEEAAGVAKYKRRKHETKLKLKHTQNDLERVEDLLFEIEKNMKSLKSQANKAERYVKLQSEYKMRSMDLASISSRELTQKIEKEQGRLQQIEDEKLKLSTMSNESESSLEETRLKLIEMEKQLSNEQKALNEFSSSINKYESDKRLKNETLRMLNQRQEELRRQLSADKEQHERLNKDIDDLSEGLEAKEKELSKSLLEKSAREESKLKAQSSLLEKREDLQSTQSKLSGLRSDYFALEKNIAVNSTQLQTIERELNERDNQSEVKSVELDAASKEIKQLKAEILNKENAFKKLQHKQEGIKTELLESEAVLQDVKNKVAQLNRTIDAKQHDHDLTKSLIDNLEGYPESLRFLSSRKQSWSADPQLLSDIINCHQDYKAVIENYLEPYLNYYVVDTSKEAFDAIDLLSDSGKGRASFFIADLIGPNQAQEPFSLPGCLPAIDVIDRDDKYNKIIVELLGNVFLLNDSVSSKGIQELISKHPNLVFLSVDGRISASKKSLQGGSIGLFEGKRLGRKKNLEKLNKQLSKLRKELKEAEKLQASLEKKIAKLKSADLSETIDIAKTEILKLENAINLLESTQDQHRLLISDHKDRVGALQAARKNFHESISTEKLKFERLEKERQKLANVTENLEKTFIEEEEKFKLIEEDYNSSNILCIQLQNRLNAQKNDISMRREQLHLVDHRISNAEEVLLQTQKEVDEVLNTATYNDDDLLKMYREREEKERALKAKEDAYYARRESIQKVEDGLRNFRRLREEKDEAAMLVKEGMNQLRLDYRGLIERIAAEFRLNREDLEAHEPESEVDLDDTQQRVESLRSKLENFGIVNPMALEAYDEVKERFEFIGSQRQDLLDAEASLLQTIDEIDETARVQFLETFEKIRNNFHDVFRALFTEEDTCELILTDPEIPLESEVNIIARPKGKRPLSINQLSGGEKTLTATALLFSIYLFKPAPFCVFDEVDAPLDDANIDKFNNIIRDFSDNSQFIIVTHNKRTMLATDVIYGITMQEQGVSKVVPVDLRSLEVEEV